MARLNKRPAKLWTLDTETRGLFGDMFRVGLYDGKNYFAFDRFSEIIEVIREYSDFENHVYVHNLDFDVSKVAPDLFNYDSVSMTKSVIINGSIATLHTASMILHDSFKLLPSSLDKLCKSFGIEEHAKRDLTEYMKEHGYAVYVNGVFDKDKSLGNFFENVPADDPVLNEYLMYDCISLFDIITIVEKISRIGLETLVYCPTTASLAMRVYKQNHKEDYAAACKQKFFGTTGQAIELFLRRGYYGGRTEVFQPQIEKAYHYDVNSLYPFVMKVANYPCGIPRIYHKSEAEKIYKIYRENRRGGGFLQCKIFVPDMHIPPLPKRDYNGKLIFPIGHLHGVWTIFELQHAEKLGCVIEEYETMIFYDKMLPIFRAYVEYWEEVKKTSTGAKREFAKLMLNTLYGKFGMNRARSSYANIEDIGAILESGEPYTIHRHTQNMIDFEFVEYITHSKAEYIQPQISAYVTSYARVYLHQHLLEQEAKGAVAYCDTDSIVSEAEMSPDKIDKYIFGKWDLEKTIESGIFLQPKLYAERHIDGGETIKAKGIPKSIKNNIHYADFEKWLEQIKEGKEQYITIFEGLKARQKFISMLKNNDDFDAALVMSKRVNTFLEQKRKIDYVNNTTLPHKREDYGDKPDEYILKTPFEDILRNVVQKNVIDEMVKAFGFIRTIKPRSTYYKLYNEIPENKRVNYFRDDGKPITQWVKNIDWSVEEILTEMRYK